MSHKVGVVFTKIIVVSARKYLALVFPLVDILLKGKCTPSLHFISVLKVKGIGNTFWWHYNFSNILQSLRSGCDGICFTVHYNYIAHIQQS